MPFDDHEIASRTVRRRASLDSYTQALSAPAVAQLKVSTLVREARDVGCQLITLRAECLNLAARRQ